ncbi:MAG: glycoside hydrolase family 92 protein [Ruminococcaceae bacterium]|nr:glycoside hydrolase family 92 protein [Oscillospiraceae bacterium]
MKRNYVDPFHGCGNCTLPSPRGIAATWFFPKAQTGNTHPGAAVPFGPMCVIPYSGGYPTGYGVNRPTSYGPAPLMDVELKLKGFTHMAHSGTGAIGYYYNYARFVPLGTDGLAGLDTACAIADEHAEPGFYSVRFPERKLLVELTASRLAAAHRYTYDEGKAVIAVDFAAAGLNPAFGQRFTAASDGMELKIADDGVYAHVCFHTIHIYFYAAIENAAAQLFRSGELLGADSLTLGGEVREHVGAVFTCDGAVANCRLGVSLRSFERARANAQAIGSFDEVCEAAKSVWDRVFDLIDIDTDRADVREIFWSCLYHSLIKPVNFHGESYDWEDDACWTDYATFWDIAKTQLPLCFTLFPEEGADMVKSWQNFFDNAGLYPPSLTLTRAYTLESVQSRALIWLCTIDAWKRGIKVDVERAIDTFKRDLQRDFNRDFTETGVCPLYLHIIDLSEACCRAAEFCRMTGHDEDAAYFAQYADNWRNAFDAETGLLSTKSNYYEGTHWNYSFRQTGVLADRIELAGGRERFTQLLDQFFGYGAQPAYRLSDAGDAETMLAGLELHRFEGFNNEPDMEIPYTYTFVGRHDRVCEIVRAGMRDMFTTGRGGIPGNEDSGSLSSLYVWNAMGIFPTFAGDCMLIGSPVLKSATIHLPSGHDFAIRTVNHSDDNIYVSSITFNGVRLDRAWLTLDEFYSGGELVLEMSAEPASEPFRSPLD